MSWVLVSGTPGVGKSTFADELGQKLGWAVLEVGDLIREKQLYEEWDEELNCSIFDEKMVLEELSRLRSSSPVPTPLVVVFHSVDFFPEDFFSHVVVLRAETSELYDRLEGRGYEEAKIRENVECEIFQTILEEAVEVFGEKVKEITNNTPVDMQKSLKEVVEWVKGS